MATAVEVANAYIALTVKAPGIKKAVDRELGAVSASGDAAGRSIGNRLTGALGKVVKVGVAAVGTAVATGLGAAFVKGFQRLNAIDTARAKLTGLGHDATTVGTVMDNALASVKGTAFGLGDAATTAAQLVAAQIQPGEELERVLKSTANSAAAAGVELGEMGSIYAKVASVGKAQNDVLQQVADRGIPIYQALGDQLGVTADQVFDMASKGEIGFAQFEAAMTAAAGTVADELGNTVGGSWANFMASLGRIGAGLLEGVFPQIAPTLQAITSVMAPLEERAAAVGEKVGAVVAPAFEWLANALSGGFDTSGISNVLGYLTPLGAALQIMQPILPAIQQAFSGVSSAIGGALATALAASAPALGSLVISLAELAADVIPVLLPIITQLVDQFAGFASQVLPMLVPALVAVVQAGADLASGLMPVLAAIGPAIGPIAVGIGAVVAAFKAWSLAQKAWAAVTGAVKAAQATMVAATYGQAGATYAATGAQKALNTAFKMSPLGWLVTIISTVVAALVWFFTQTELGKQIWQTAMDAIATAATWLWETVLSPVITAIGDGLNWLWENVLQPVGAGFQAAFEAVGAVATWLWENVLSPVFGFIGAAAQVVGGIIKLAVDLIVNYFRFWGAVVVWLWENAIQPVFAWIGEVVNWVWTNIIKPVVDLVVAYFQMWGAIVMWLYNNAVKPVFDAIAAVFNWIWTNIIQPVIDWIREKITILGLAFRIMYRDYIKPAWEAVADVLRSVWVWINDHVFTPFKEGIDLIKQGFDVAVEGIKTAWKKIKEAAAVPVNFILGTVWNDGLRSFWNDVVDELGLDDMKLKKAPLIGGFAQGGVLPGYTPGRDVHDFYSPTAGRLRLSGGEAIMRPEFTRAVGGPAGVARLNALARSGQMPTAAFAGGGTWWGNAWNSTTQWVSDAWGNVSRFAGDVWDNVKNAARVATEFMGDPIGAVNRHIIDGIIKPLVGTDGNTFLQTAAQMPLTVAKGLGEKVKDWFTSNPSAGQPGEAMPWQSIWARVKANIPGAVMTSNYRSPGANAAVGGYGKSYHMQGRAIDIIPATMSMFNQVKSLFPNATELIFTPAGAGQLSNGRSFAGWSPAVRAQHYNHIHLAMKNGGVMPQLYDQGGWLPHGGFAVNQTGKPEAVLTPDESIALKQGLGSRQIIVQNVRGATADEVADQIVWAERRLARGGKYTGRIVI